MIKMPLTQGKFAIIDDKDFALVSQYKWHALKSHNNYYAAHSTYDKKRKKMGTLLMHRLLTNAPKGIPVDHFNFNGLDNRQQNIRLCSNAQNVRRQRPQKRPKSSRYKGVSRAKTKWKAGIKYNGRTIHIGNFCTEIEAAKAYDKKSKELFGPYAFLNLRA